MKTPYSKSSKTIMTPFGLKKVTTPLKNFAVVNNKGAGEIGGVKTPSDDNINTTEIDGKTVIVSNSPEKPNTHFTPFPDTPAVGTGGDVPPEQQPQHNPEGDFKPDTGNGNGGGNGNGNGGGNGNGNGGGNGNGNGGGNGGGNGNGNGNGNKDEEKDENKKQQSSKTWLILAACAVAAIIISK